MAQEVTFLPAPQDQLAIRPSKRPFCNQDPAWTAYITSLVPVITAIAVKSCAADESLRQDCVQEARFELAKHYPEDCRSYRDWMYGLIDYKKCMVQLSRFCRQVARNTIYSTLNPYTTGSWRIGRTRSVVDKKTGKSRKVHHVARFSSMDELVDEYGMQIDTNGNISWPEASMEGVIAGTANAKQSSRIRWYDQESVDD